MVEYKVTWNVPAVGCCSARRDSEHESNALAARLRGQVGAKVRPEFTAQDVKIMRREVSEWTVDR